MASSSINLDKSNANEPSDNRSDSENVALSSTEVSSNNCKYFSTNPMTHVSLSNNPFHCNVNSAFESPPILESSYVNQAVHHPNYENNSIAFTSVSGLYKEYLPFPNLPGTSNSKSNLRNESNDASEFSTEQRQRGNRAESHSGVVPDILTFKFTSESSQNDLLLSSQSNNPCEEKDLRIVETEKLVSLREDLEDKNHIKAYNFVTESLSDKCAKADNTFKFVDDQHYFHEPSNIIFLCRNEIDQLSEKCISKLLLEKERYTVNHDTKDREILTRRLHNLSLQLSQFENVTSDAKLQLSYAYSPDIEGIKKLQQIRQEFCDECKSFEHFFPAYAFRDDVVSAIRDNQVLIINADSSYCFNILLPIIVEKTHQEKFVVCCEGSELAKSWSCNWLVHLLGDKVVTRLAYEEFLENPVSSFNEEEMLEYLINLKFVFYQAMCVIYNVPLIRSVMCDILLANFRDMLEINRHSRLVVLIPYGADLLGYKKYFSKFTSVSVLKTQSLNFPVTTIWKKNALTPLVNYVEEVVRTVLAILVLENTGDILAFLPALGDIEHATMILNESLPKLRHHDVELISISENGLFNFNPFTKSGNTKRNVFLATSCAETLYFPSVQFVIDCGIKNVYVYDRDLRTDVPHTTFISCKNAKLRKTLAGAFCHGICYRIYNKENYSKGMQRKDSPEILMVNPLNTMIKIFQYRPVNVLNTQFIEAFSQKIKDDSLRALQTCGAIENNKLTSLGRNMSKLPFEAKYSKLFLLGLERGFGFEAVVLITFFTSRKIIFQSSNDEKQQRKMDAAKLQFAQSESDTLTWLHIYKTFKEKGYSSVWCDNHQINYKVLQNIHSNVEKICHIIKSCLGVNIVQDFSDQENSVLTLIELLFDCFRDNLCVFTGHIKSGYKVLSTLSFASIHPSSILFQWENLPQFVLFDHLIFTNRCLMFHITAIPDDLIMKGLENGTLEYEHEHLFEQILTRRVVEHIGEELMNEMMLGENGEKQKIIEDQIRKESGSDLIFLEPSVNKGQVYIYALPNYIDYAQCAIEDILKSNFNNILNEDHVEVLELKNGQNVIYVEINWSKGAIATSLTFSSQSQISNVPHKILASSNMEYDVNDSVGFPYYLHISWIRRYCSGEGYVNFSNDADFIVARKLALRCIRLLETGVFFEISSRDKNQLHMTGLPPETCIKNLEKELQLLLPDSKIASIALNYKRPFQTSDDDIHLIKSKIATKCQEYDVLSDCDIIVLKPEPEDLDMVACIYAHNNEILEFLADLLSTVVVKNKKDVSKIMYHVIINCSVDICKFLKPRFSSELVRLERDLKSLHNYKTEFQFSFRVDMETEDKAVINVSSSNNETLKLLQRTINDLLEGEILNFKNVKGLENLFFHSGHVWLKNLEKAEDVYIVEDNRMKTIRLYGSEDCCQSAKSHIIKFLEDAENDVMQTISLSSEQNNSMLLKAIIKEYGVNLDTLVQLCGLRSSLLDIKARQLLLRGNKESIIKAENCIQTLYGALDITNVDSENPQEICPVCVCPASHLAFRLEHCGHLYCLECIQNLIKLAQFPLCCCAEKCSKDIVLKDIKKVLKNDPEEIKMLTDKSLKDYLERNRSQIIFCPAPDCSMFFYKDHVSGNKQNCPLCRNDICTSCNVLYHGGYTCKMYQNSKKDPDYSFKIWQNTTSQCKQCPRCKTAIEKISGCNRMHCSSCKGNFCWICVKEFNSEKSVYNHIHSVHKGMLFA